jgi:hypothetical protein
MYNRSGFDALPDHQKIFTLALSILLWAFAGISGIDYFKVDKLTGNRATAKVLHRWSISSSADEANVSQLLLITSSMAEIPLSAVKISILLFYKRVFVTKRFGMLVWALISIITVWGFIFFFVSTHVQFDAQRPNKMSDHSP